MAKGVYRRYRGSRNRKGFVVPSLVALCVIAAVILIYISFNLEAVEDGTTVLDLPFTEKTWTFGEPEIELIVEDPVDVVVSVEVSAYEKRVEKPMFLTVNKDFDKNLSALSGVNTVAVKYKSDKGLILSDEDAKNALSKIKNKKLNPCAMISCFRDDGYARELTEIACVKSDGSIWADGAGYAWINPYDDRSGEYVCSIIEKAYNLGYREILLTNVCFPAGDAHYNVGMEKGAAIVGFLDRVKEFADAKGDLEVAIYFDGKDSAVSGQELDAIIERFYRIYTNDANIYNKVGTLIPEEKLERRIVNLSKGE